MKIIWSRCRLLLAVHLCNEAAERARLRVRERADLLAEPGFPDRANLIYHDLCVAIAHTHTEPSAPCRMQRCRERTHRDGIQTLVEDVEAHDDDWPCFGHLRSLGWIE